MQAMDVAGQRQRQQGSHRKTAKDNGEFVGTDHLLRQAKKREQNRTDKRKAGALHRQQAGANRADARDLEYDFYHWSAILRSVSGFEVYRKVYRNVIRPEKVAELLILRPDMPRSLAACTQEVLSNLTMIANEQSSETLRRAGRLRADLQYGRIDEILATGLHAYLTQFLERVGTLGVGISRDFLVPVES